jgi:hypothetical protein
MNFDDFRIGQKVMTPDGEGEIMIFEPCGVNEDYFRIGVKHFVFPVARPRMYPDDILYYQLKEVTPLDKIIPEQLESEEK